MIDPRNGHKYREKYYEGYGEFGGKDFYELLSEIHFNESNRLKGIDLYFSKKDSNFLSPILVKNPKNYEKYIGQAPKPDENQGYFDEDTEY